MTGEEKVDRYVWSRFDRVIHKSPAFRTPIHPQLRQQLKQLNTK